MSASATFGSDDAEKSVRSDTAQLLNTLATYFTTAVDTDQRTGMTNLRQFQMPYEIYSALTTDPMLDAYARSLVFELFASPIGEGAPPTTTSRYNRELAKEYEDLRDSVYPGRQSTFGFRFFLAQLDSAMIIEFGKITSARHAAVKQEKKRQPRGFKPVIPEYEDKMKATAPFPAEENIDPMAVDAPAKPLSRRVILRLLDNENVVLPPMEVDVTPPVEVAVMPPIDVLSSAYRVKGGWHAGYYTLAAEPLDRANITLYHPAIGRGSYGATFSASMGGDGDYAVKIGQVDPGEVDRAQWAGRLGLGPIVITRITVDANINAIPRERGKKREPDTPEIQRFPSHDPLTNKVEIVVMTKLDSSLHAWQAKTQALDNFAAIRLAKLLTAAAHAGLHHCDLKLDNIMLSCHRTKKGRRIVDRFYLIDFGLSYATHSTVGSSAIATAGTPTYYNPTKHIGWSRCAPVSIDSKLGRQFDYLCLLWSVEMHMKPMAVYHSFIETLIERAVTDFGIKHDDASDVGAYFAALPSTDLYRQEDEFAALVDSYAK